MFEYKININDEEYLLLNEEHALNSKIGKIDIMILRVVMAVLCITLVVITDILLGDLIVVAIEAIGMLIIYIYFSINIKKRYVKVIRKAILLEGKKEGSLPYHKEYILKFDDEVIREIIQDSISMIKYTSVEGISVTDKAIYIYHSDLNAYIIPLKVLSDEQEQSEFVEFIKNKTKLLDNVITDT